MRPRWAAHLVALTFLLGTVAIMASRDAAAALTGLTGLPKAFVEAAVLSVPGLALLPLYRKVSFRKSDWLSFLLIPIWGFVIAWKVGFRLTRLPYRDWPPGPDEFTRARRIPRTTYHVVIPEQGASVLQDR